MTSVDRLRRSLLYVPGDRPKMVTEAGCRGTDGPIPNLEDAVAPELKGSARRTVANALVSTDFGNAERIVRINPLDSDCGFSDLLAIVPCAPDAVLLSKVASGVEVRGGSPLNGEMIEAPHLLRARKILEAAKRMGIEGG